MPCAASAITWTQSRALVRRTDQVDRLNKKEARQAADCLPGRDRRESRRSDVGNSTLPVDDRKTGKPNRVLPAPLHSFASFIHVFATVSRTGFSTVPSDSAVQRRVHLASIGEIRREAARLYNRASRGEVDPQAAGRLGTLLALIAKLIEGDDHERRLEALEAQTKDKHR